VFADSPTGSKGAGVSDESRPRAYLLHTATGMSETDLAASNRAGLWPDSTLGRETDDQRQLLLPVSDN
jgi:hypothetical protein